MLTSIFALFVFIDLATRGGKIFGKQLLPSHETLFYYFYQFSNYLHFFFPLSFLLASIQVLLDLNAHNELVALQMGGLSRRQLLSPFFRLASCLFLLLLANHEWVAPKAQNFAYEYVKAYARHKKRPLREHLHVCTLNDGSEIVFQQFDKKKKELFDVFWLADDSTVWYMKFFQTDLQKGRFVDRFTWIESTWVKTDRFEEFEFPQIVIDEQKALQPFVPYERRSLSELTKEAFTAKGEKPKLLSHLFYKLFSSLLLFISILAISPICFAFSRKTPAFAILACSLFGFLSMMTLLDGLLVLGENQVIPAAAAFGLPLAIWLGICYRPFKKLSH
jgi:lipopolysaccharide export LptBFGC system permease protein LptF